MAAEEMAAASGPIPASQRDHQKTFFRQSGWLMMATVGSGFLTWGVHFLNKAMPPEQYGTFLTMLAITTCIPSMPLQMVFARQTASAVAQHRERQLAGMIRWTWIGTVVLCVLGAVALLFFQHDLMARWQLANPAGLWATLAAVLFSFWFPIFLGVMQGQQNFLWYGWSFVGLGVTRLGFAALFVFAAGASLKARLAGTPVNPEDPAARWILDLFSTGLMAGVAISYGVAVAMGIWQTRGLWAARSERFDRHLFSSQILPLMLGFGAYQFLFAADTVFVKTFLPDQVEYYGAAGTLARALIWVVGPLTTVMFPKIVHSTARAEKTDVMGWTLLGTALLAGAGVFGLWLLGPWVVRFVYTTDYVATTTQVLLWYAAAMLPLTVGSVLVNSLLAKSDFRIVPVLIALAAAYGITLSHFHSSLVQVLQILGTYNLALLLICSVFTWGFPRRPAANVPTA